MARAVTKPLTVVMFGVDNHATTKVAMGFLRLNSTSSLSHLVLVDNGSDPPFEAWGADQLVRYEENVGGNAVHHRLLKDGLIEPTHFIGFVHVDLVVRELAWDWRVLETFRDQSVDMLGFVGSPEIDELGGRGGGTALNYLGDFYEGVGQASTAEYHGRRVKGVMPAAVLDHAAMFWTLDALLKLTPQEGHYAPEHFQDRIWSCEVLERGGRIAVLGISCDHFGGGIGPGNAKADVLRRRWLDAEGLPYDPARSDLAVYQESERRFLKRFRDTGFIPLRVAADFSIQHQHVLRGGTWRPRR